MFITESLRLGEDDEEAVEGVNAALGAMLSASPEDGTKVRCHSFIHSCFHFVFLSCFLRFIHLFIHSFNHSFVLAFLLHCGGGGGV